MRAIAVLLTLAACTPEARLEIAEGSVDNIEHGWVHPGDAIAWQAHFDGVVLDCGGTWLVNGLVGGSALVGEIDACGHYVAPAAFPPGLFAIEIEAIFPGRAAVSGAESATDVLTPVP